MLNLKWEKRYPLPSNNCHATTVLAMSVTMQHGIRDAAIEKSVVNAIWKRTR